MHTDFVSILENKRNSCMYTGKWKENPIMRLVILCNPQVLKLKLSVCYATKSLGEETILRK